MATPLQPIYTLPAIASAWQVSPRALAIWRNRGLLIATRRDSSVGCTRLEIGRFEREHAGLLEAARRAMKFRERRAWMKARQLTLDL